MCSACQCFNFEGCEPYPRPFQDEAVATALDGSKPDSNIVVCGYSIGNEISFAFNTRYNYIYYELS